MDRWNDKVAIVTGASSGIGEAITEELVNSGLKVVGLARRKDRLDEIGKRLEGKKGTFYPLKADISKEDDILNAFKWTTENVGVVHILVNNAGIARATNLTEGNTELWKQVIDTNVFGLCIATREAIKIMRANQVDGHVIHMNSISGLYVTDLPLMNVYPASKYAVTALTETLRQELNAVGRNIKVTSIHPGFVRTEIVKAAGVPEEFLKTLGKVPALHSEDVAQAVIYVLSTPPHVQVHQLTIRPVGATG